MWIKTEDSLPEETQAYGCTTDDVLCYDQLTNKIFISFLARARDGLIWFDADYKRKHVTHWQYLPKVPK